MIKLLVSVSIKDQMKTSKLTPTECVSEIIDLNKKLADFWSKAHGWAPDEAAALMTKSRLDRQASLSVSLEKWVESETLSDGDLILAWANLGALVEGTMKLFLAVFYHDYKSDVHSIKDKKGKLNDPDGLALEKLKQFFKNRELFTDWHDFIEHVQQRRNAIHAFKDRPIGDRDELLKNIKAYCFFLLAVSGILPYPEDYYS